MTCQDNYIAKKTGTKNLLEKERERVGEEEEEEEKCLGFLGVFYERFSDQRVCLLTFCLVFISVSENGRSDGKNGFFSTRLFLL